MVRTILLRGLLVLGAAYVIFLGALYAAMRKPPAEFSRFMMKLPQPFMYLAPFPPMWKKARGGTLQPGDPAPAFVLSTADRKSQVSLQDFRGQRPVILIFGSYT